MMLKLKPRKVGLKRTKIGYVDKVLGCIKCFAEIVLVVNISVVVALLTPFLCALLAG